LERKRKGRERSRKLSPLTLAKTGTLPRGLNDQKNKDVQEESGGEKGKTTLPDQLEAGMEAALKGPSRMRGANGVTESSVRREAEKEAKGRKNYRNLYWDQK